MNATVVSTNGSKGTDVRRHEFAALVPRAEHREQHGRSIGARPRGRWRSRFVRPGSSRDAIVPEGDPSRSWPRARPIASARPNPRWLVDFAACARLKREATKSSIPGRRWARGDSDRARVHAEAGQSIPKPRAKREVRKDSGAARVLGHWAPGAFPVGVGASGRVGRVVPSDPRSMRYATGVSALVWILRYWSPVGMRDGCFYETCGRDADGSSPGQRALRHTVDRYTRETTRPGLRIDATLPSPRRGSATTSVIVAGTTWL
jgi:hypothetical protein